MPGSNAFVDAAQITDDERLERVLERTDHAVDQIGTLREDVSILAGDVAALRSEGRVHHAELRAELIDRDAAILKWLLVLFVAQMAALGALMATFR